MKVCGSALDVFPGHMVLCVFEELLVSLRLTACKPDGQVVVLG